MSETSDSAEVETETKLHNVTANARTRATNARPEKRRQKKKREREREGRSWRTWGRCVRAYTSSYRRRRRAERELKKKKGHVVLHKHIYAFKCECIVWRDLSVCTTVTVNVCREAYPPVERGADESVELSAHPTPNPPRNQPLLPWRTPTPLLQPRFSLVYSRSPPLYIAVFLSPIFRSTLCCNPCAPEQRVEGKMGKTRVGEIQCKFLLVDMYESLIILHLRIFICARSRLYIRPRSEKNVSLYESSILRSNDGR